VVDDIKFEAGK